MGIGLATMSENDQDAGPFGRFQLRNCNILGARFDLNWPRKNLRDRGKSIRASLYGGLRPSFA